VRSAPAREPLTKAELRVLEQAFAAETLGRRYQSKVKLARSLVDRGYLADAQEVTGLFRCKWLELTYAGRFAYCQSCEPEEESTS
jgi:hypothetical protein